MSLYEFVAIISIRMNFFYENSYPIIGTLDFNREGTHKREILMNLFN